MEKSIHAYYYGMVQGVGFRYSAERAAFLLGLKGYVKNLDDGRVEVYCEGKEDALREFLKKMQSIFKAYIRDTDVEWGEADGETGSFDIRF